MVFMNRPGHAVSLFGCRVFGARIWLFCAVFCPHFVLLWDMSVLGSKLVFMNRPGHAVSLFGRPSVWGREWDMSVLERQNRAKTLALNDFLM